MGLTTKGLIGAHDRDDARRGRPPLSSPSAMPQGRCGRRSSSSATAGQSASRPTCGTCWRGRRALQASSARAALSALPTDAGDHLTGEGPSSASEFSRAANPNPDCPPALGIPEIAAHQRIGQARRRGVAGDGDRPPHVNAALRPPRLAVAAGSEAWQDPGAAPCWTAPTSCGSWGVAINALRAAYAGIARRFCRRAGKSGGNGQCSAPAVLEPSHARNVRHGSLGPPQPGMPAIRLRMQHLRMLVSPSFLRAVRSSDPVLECARALLSDPRRAFSTRFATASVLSTRRSSVRCIANLSLCSRCSSI